MDALAFEHHLTSPQGAGISRTAPCPPPRAVTPAATRSRSRWRSTASASAMPASRRTAAARPRRRQRRGRARARRRGARCRARRPGHEIAARARRALARQAARRGARRRRARTSAGRSGPGARPAAALRPRPPGDAGGDERRVDSAVAAHLCAQGRGKVCVLRRQRFPAPRPDALGRGDPRAVGRPRERRRAQLLLGHRGRPGTLARALDGPAALHPRPARRVPRRGRRAVHRRLRGGETPNPCVGCNGHVRLDAMLALADRLGCAWLATGHYARVAESDDPQGPLLRAAVDPAKDQTYMLAALDPASLARMRFPLGELTQGRRCARSPPQAGLPVAAKADSQDLCFLAGTDRAALPGAPRRHRRTIPGEIVATDGTGARPPRRPAPLHRRAATRAGRGVLPRGRAAVRARARTPPPAASPSGRAAPWQPTTCGSAARGCGARAAASTASSSATAQSRCPPACSATPPPGRTEGSRSLSSASRSTAPPPVSWRA